jgi:hypothetical protein
VATREEYLNHPPKEVVRGLCPMCGGEVIANLYYVQGKGYILMYECVGSLREEQVCDYRRVL